MKIKTALKWFGLGRAVVQELRAMRRERKQAEADEGARSRAASRAFHIEGKRTAELMRKRRSGK